MTNLAIALMLALQVALPGVSQDRLRVVSEDMVSVVDEEFEKGSLKSNMSREIALPMLAAAAAGESALRTDIENCKISGDNGKSVGLGQVMRGPNWKGYTRKEICSNRKVQLKLSLHVLDSCWNRDPGVQQAFRCYTSGNSKKITYASKHEHTLYKRVRSNMISQISRQSLQTCCLYSLSSFYVREKNICEM
jgi:hypothetical protein